MQMICYAVLCWMRYFTSASIDTKMSSVIRMSTMPPWPAPGAAPDLTGAAAGSAGAGAANVYRGADKGWGIA